MTERKYMYLPFNIKVEGYYILFLQICSLDMFEKTIEAFSTANSRSYNQLIR